MPTRWEVREKSSGTTVLIDRGPDDRRVIVKVCCQTDENGVGHIVDGDNVLAYNRAIAAQIVREHDLAQAAEAMREALEVLHEKWEAQRKAGDTYLTCGTNDVLAIEAALRLAKGD